MDLNSGMSRKLRVLTSAAIFSALAIVAPLPSVAQDSEPSYAIEEIVVTSQKREENLQEVPISITALSETMIEDRGIKNIQDMFSSSPGLTGYEAPSSRGNISVNIRGIGAGSPNNLSIDPANAIYIDGVYLGKATGLGVDSFDLQRVEILRGPQGTLYGRNSTGGAINFITKRPAGELNFKGQATAGSDGLQEYRLRLDLPAIGETFSTAFSVQKRERDELYKNTNPNSPGFENIDRLGYRFAASWEPSDNFRADYAFDHTEIDNENTQAIQNVGMNPFGAGVLAAPGFPTNVSINSNADRVAALTQTQQFLPFLGPAFFAPEVQQYNQWITDYLEWNAAGRAQFTRDRSSLRQDFGSADSAHVSNNEIDGHSLILTWNRDDMGAFGDVEFKSTTGFRQTDNRNESDLDGIDNSVRPGAGGLTNGVIADLTLLTIGGLFFDSVSP
ncbi:MAG: TonB-dependent receptor plug domain-containing protein, partial [Gammaproteobacteria bacterium]|nr:TonB-dependent receptor plug domain-containing protein [Gammaproteobacteria bacterium]